MKKLSVKEQVEVIKQGVVQIVSEDALAEKLKESRPLRIKYGADPSAPDIHLGHTVPLTKLRQFQDLGHEVIFIIGDFTAMIGDPTGRNEIRKPLSAEEVKDNAKTYKKQIFKVLDPEKTKVVYNSHWLDKLQLKDIVQLTAKYTVARLLERDDFLKRYKQGLPISMVEFLYPLLQGYDSVEMKADVEIGGTDQTFNLLVSREIQREYGQPPEIILTLPILEGTDGVNKMSKSLGNYIGVNDPPPDMFGKVMSISDELMLRYYQLLENVSGAELEKIKKIHPMEAKKELALRIVKRYWSEAEASSARDGFEQVFSKRQNPDQMQPLKTVPGINIIDLLIASGAVSSKGEAKRLIQQNAVQIDGEKITDAGSAVRAKDGAVLKIGKRNFFKLTPA